MYAYVGGNPVNAIDPLGLLANICRDGNNINVDIPCNFSGTATTPENIANITNAIQAGLTGTFGNYNVVTTVSISSTRLSDPQNNISLTAGGGRSNAANWSVPAG